MPKKKSKKASSKTKTPTTEEAPIKEKKLSKNEEIQEKILSNLVSLQKVHADMAEKFSKLSDQIASLLGLFEMTARSFSKNPANQVSEKDKEFLDKIDTLLEQNKTLAKGLTLVEGKMRERVYGGPPRQAPPRREEDDQPKSRPLPRF